MIKKLKTVKPSTWVKLGLGVLLFTIFIFIIPFSAIYNWFTLERIILWVKSAQSNAWTGLLFFGAFALGVLAFPITIFPIVGGVLFNFWVALPLNILAATSGAWLAYGIARFFGREAVETLLKGRLKSFDKFTEHRGIKTVALVRWVGVPPFIVANYAFGLSGIHPRDYLIGTALGIAPWITLMTYLSQSLWQAALVGGEKGLMAAVVSKLGPMIGLSVTVVLIVVLTYIVKSRKKAESLTQP